MLFFNLLFALFGCVEVFSWKKIFDLTVRGLSASSLSASIQDDGRLLLINKVITTRNDLIDGLIHVFSLFFTPISRVSYSPYLQLLRAYLGRDGWGPLSFRLEQCAELVEACEMFKHGPTAAD